MTQLAIDLSEKLFAARESAPSDATVSLYLEEQSQAGGEDTVKPQAGAEVGSQSGAEVQSDEN